MTMISQKAKRKVCILSFSNIKNDSRVLREINFFREIYQVSVIGYGGWQAPEGVTYFQLEKNQRTFIYLARYYFLLILGRFFPGFYDRAFWLKGEYKEAVKLISNLKCDLIHANDWDALPVAVKAKSDSATRVLFDAHEYSPDQGTENLLIKIFIKPFRIYLFNKNLRHVDKMVDASTRYSELYKQHFNSDSITIYNATHYREMPFNQVKPESINIIHHGFSMPGRFIEEMIKMVALTDTRYHLYLMLIPGSHIKYHNWLIKYSDKNAGGRVTFLDPVPPNQIIEKINSFDLGLPFLKVRQLSQYNSQPNKFFDYIMAGLGIVVPPLPGMASFVEDSQIGKVSISQSPKEFAELLNSLTSDEINQYKKNSLELAKKYNSEIEMEKLREIYKSLLTE